MKTILTRRSIRKFTEQPIADELLEELLRAAMSAPSGRNARPWQFIVVRERELLDGMRECAPNTALLAGAPAAVVVCGDLEKELVPGLWVLDCAAATQNLLLAAHASGLGAVWLSVYPNEEKVNKLRDYFGAPEHIIPLAVVALGYPAEEKSVEDRFDPQCVHYERW
ncbi:MAG TPA: nitroreductase family protein [Firmicutes bacterium]|nr:nitroreductase family protein [Bacillota bacterium]HAA37827.1 nitroreductase family protein [Bacillota bacterium]